MERLLAAVEDIDVLRFRRKDLPHALLLQLDVRLVPGSGANGLHPETFGSNTVYSGWLRDTRHDRLCSWLHDDELTIDPLAASVIGEFSYATIGTTVASIVSDHYATHPIYYHRAPDGQWTVSNDLRLVLLSPDVALRIERSACSYFLTSAVMVDENEFPRGKTFFADIRKVEPDSVLTIALDGLTHKIVPRERFPWPRLASIAPKRDECVEAFKDVFERSVRDRISAGAGGLLLSGGIDSSTVLGACLSSGINAPFSVSMAFRDPDLVMSHDEKLLASLFGTHSLPHTIIHADGALRLPALDDPSPFVDGPNSSANPLVAEAFAAEFERRHVSLVMTGEGGDIVLGEGMHDWIFDGVRQSEGIAGLHRYLTNRLGMRFGSTAYLRGVLGSFLPSLGRCALVCETRQQRVARLPGYLKRPIAQANTEASAPAPGQGRGRAMRFAYAAHHYMHSMLFPRASYFDAINVQCIHSHPFLDPRVIQFALTCPPHVHHDYFNLDRRNPYASAKMLARLAYRRELPEAITQKTHKTSYASMARRMFHNSAGSLYSLASRPMLLNEWGLVDQSEFRRQLMAYIAAMEDPNANPGIRYHYMRGVYELETWLRRFSGPRAQLEQHLKFRPVRRFL
ncbi:hypothetical protein C9I57_10235 [Trinickia symbiotica]|uniref:asparagine synthase (glutamine-hydrolyzing) n=1 Tax=Trinickia symbiotica TaxID=863227 RepID=A0A2T3XX76_9BURK|nr:hypothetical protein C9I57_10235 [Trinickia symbiotica]